MTSTELMNEHKFNDVINDYYNSNDIVDIANVIYSYLILNRENEAYEYYHYKKDYLEDEYPIESINLLLEIIVRINDSSFAYKEGRRLANLPYKSQEVEELIKDFVKLYNKKKKFLSKDFKKENILNELQNNNPDRVINALVKISKEKDLIDEYLPFIYVVFNKRKEYDKAKMMLLFWLICYHYNGEITIFRDNKYYFINPYESKKEIEDYLKLQESVFVNYQKNEKNITAIDFVKGFYSSVVFYQLPVFYTKKELTSILHIAIRLAYTNSSIGFEEDKFQYLGEIDMNFLKNNEILFYKAMKL